MQIHETRDNVITQKAHRIGSHFLSAFGSKRKELGLMPLVANSILGQEAYLTSVVLAAEEYTAETHYKYEVRVKEAGYEGKAGFSYIRHIWPTDTPNQVIVDELLNLFFEDPSLKSDTIWEDFGLGICHGHPGNDQSRLGLCVVVGLGWTEGYAYALKHINSVRVSEGADPLELSLELRETARRLCSLDEVSTADLNNAMMESGYGGPNRRLRFAYNGGYKLMPKDLRAVTYEEQGKRIADTLLEEHKDLLMRPDWKHVGLASRLVTRSAVDNSQGVWLQVSFILAWQMPGDAKRPAHFPPSIAEDEQARTGPSANDKPRKRRWWPF